MKYPEGQAPIFHIIFLHFHKSQRNWRWISYQEWAWKGSIRSQKEEAGVCWGRKLSTWKLIASQDCHCQPVQNHHLISIKYFRVFKMKSSTHFHKSQLWHPHVWCIFCQQWCLFRALALLCTTHGHTSVFNFQFSSFLQHFCCGTSAVWHLLIFVTQNNTCPNSPAMTNSTELFFVMSCLVTLHAFQCS